MRVQRAAVPIFVLVASAAVSPEISHAAQDAPVEAAPSAAPARSLLDLTDAVTDNGALAALGWLKFMSVGYKNPADHFGNGEAADAELALGDAVEKAVKTVVDALPGKKGKSRLNEMTEGQVTKVDAAGITIAGNTFGKPPAKTAEQLIPWADVDPKVLALALSKGKPTAEADLAAISTLKLLGGDTADAKRQAGKLTGELGKKLAELSEAAKSFGPELKAARALDGILREPDPAQALEHWKAAWPDIKTAKLASELGDKLKTQFILRGEKVLAGEKALAEVVHGKVTPTPARVDPAGGPGAIGVEIEYEFDKTSEGNDFDPLTLNRTLVGVLRGVQGGSAPPEVFGVAQSRLTPTTVNGGVVPLGFVGKIEIECQGGLNEKMERPDAGLIALGWTTEDGTQVALVKNFFVLDTIQNGRSGPSVKKEFESAQPGMQVAVELRIGGGKMTMSQNGEPLAPLDFTAKGPLHPLVMASGKAQWFLDRLVIRGTVTAASLAALGRKVAERQAAALFGS